MCIREGLWKKNEARQKQLLLFFSPSLPEKTKNKIGDTIAGGAGRRVDREKINKRIGDEEKKAKQTE
jgi:hypothetical protein